MGTYKKLMTDIEFQEILKDLADNWHTAYLYGGTGQLVTNEIIVQKAKQLPSWYTPIRITNLKKLVGKNYYGFDCVGMIKAILWQWRNGKMGTYGSNTVPDTSADGMIELCEDVSTDMRNIKPMEAIWFKGHIGIYLGKINGEDYCIEDSPSLNDVAVSKLSYQKKWCRHGKLPWINYSNIKTDAFDVSTWIKKVQAIIICKKGDKTPLVSLLQERLKSLGYDVGMIDGDFGSKTELQLKKYQKDNKLTIDGFCGLTTWQLLFKG